jgi:hypothetical protein
MRQRQATPTLELSLEFLFELLLFLYPYGADQMGLPHNFWIGLFSWVVGIAVAIRIFWIFPFLNLSTRFKSVVASVVVVAFAILSWKPVLKAYREGHPHSDQSTVELPIQLVSWGTNPPGLAYGIVDAKQLLPYRDKYRLMLVIRAVDHSIDPLDDVNIMKSSIFEISDKNVEIDISMSQAFLRHMMALNPNYARIDYWPCVLPKGLHTQEMGTLLDISKNGGHCGMGGEQTVSRPFAIIPKPPK